MNANAALVCLIVLGTLCVPASGQPTSESWVPENDEIRKILERRIGDDHERIGIVVGIVEPGGRRFVASGSTGGESPEPVDTRTVFEIGSVTKVFTALLLADMAHRGDVALDDAVSMYLPNDVTLPERNGRTISLVDLATHTSGLPRIPSNFAPGDPGNPYADYTIEQLFAFLSSYALPRDIGARYEYSNVGFGLLGHALARAAGTDYETLVRTRITIPLGMESTRSMLSPEIRARLATGHDQRREPVPNWELPTLAGAGALRSTADDLAEFLALHLGYSGDASLTAAAELMHSVTRPAGDLGEIALGWHVAPGDETAIVWHNGGTGGYRSFVGYDPQARVGVVALTNMQSGVGVDDIGRHLLDTSVPIVPSDSPRLAPPRERTEIELAPRVLERYTGRYELAPGLLITVTREGGRLYAQLTGQPRIEILPEAEREFFYEVVDAQIVFETNTGGRATALVLHQGGREMRAERVE